MARQCSRPNYWWTILICSRHPLGKSTIVTVLARRIPTLEKTRGQVSRRHPRFGTVTRVVSQRWITGVGRSDGTRGERQTGLGSIHQTFPSSERDGHLLVSRHVSTRQKRQDHLLKCALHRGLQESQRSIGYA